MILALSAGAPALAQMEGHGKMEMEKKDSGMSMGKGGSDKGGMEMGGMGGMGGMSGHGMGGGHEMGHFFGPGWRHTLTDDQKAKINALHLKLKKDLSTLEATKALREAELGLLAVQDNPDRKSIEKKVGEIADLKRQILLTMTLHQVEMRTVLTPEQRVSFDTMVLGHGMRGR
jgi:Spy/CpxP family protein refolding chaperone